MNHSFPLTYEYQDDGSIVVRTAQGNHFAKTFDPTAAKLMEAIPDMLNALVMAKSWLDPELCLYEGISEHDRNVFESTVAAVNKAIKQTTT